MPQAVRRSARERCRPVLAGLAVVATLGFTVSLPSAALAAPAPVKPSPAAAPVNGNGKSPQSGPSTSPSTTSAPAGPVAPAPTTTNTTTNTTTDTTTNTTTDTTAATKSGKADNGAGAAPGTTSTGKDRSGSATAGSTAAAPQAAAPQSASQVTGPKVAGPQAAAPVNRTLIGPVAPTAPLAAPIRGDLFTARPATPFGPQVQRRSTAAAAVQGPRVPTRKAKATTSTARQPVRKTAVAPAAVAPGIIPDTEVLPALNTVVRRAAGEPTAPLLVALIVGLFLLIQHRIDRRDPKLAHVQLDQEPLTFRRLSYS